MAAEDYAPRLATVEEVQEAREFLLSMGLPALAVERWLDLLNAQKIKYAYCRAHAKKCEVHHPDQNSHLKAVEMFTQYRVGRPSQRVQEPPSIDPAADLESLSDEELARIIAGG